MKTVLLLSAFFSLSILAQPCQTGDFNNAEHKECFTSKDYVSCKVGLAMPPSKPGEEGVTKTIYLSTVMNGEKMEIREAYIDGFNVIVEAHLDYNKNSAAISVTEEGSTLSTRVSGSIKTGVHLILSSEKGIAVIRCSK